MFTKMHELMLENVPNVVATCVILHNVCEMFGNHFCQSESYMKNNNKVSHTQIYPQASRNQTASGIRDALAQYLSNNE